MKPLINEKSGVLVDKKEQLIFEAYKNKPLISSTNFKKEIKRNYGFKPNSNLYRELVNYQVKTFGKTLDNAVELPNVERRLKLCGISNKRRYSKLRGRRSDEK